MIESSQHLINKLEFDKMALEKTKNINLMDVIKNQSVVNDHLYNIKSL